MSKSKLLQAFKMMQFDRNIAYITYLDRLDLAQNKVASRHFSIDDQAFGRI